MNAPPKLSLTAVILTFNEEKHLARCIENVAQVAERVIIVDSYSTDRSTDIARSLGAEVFQNPFVHQAQQFQWALDNIPVHSDWIIRLDADEYLLPELVAELRQKMPGLPAGITGLLLKRRVIFMDRWIKNGYYPMSLLRVWRPGAGYIQQKWMDEHAALRHGQALLLDHDMVDHNLNHLGWWTEKHNKYALREAIERLRQESGDGSDPVKWNKSLYMRLPLFVRPFLYFGYRYVIRLGFLEGKPGLIWHILQGFWFQFLVDAKMYQIRHVAKQQGQTPQQVALQALQD